MFTVNFHANQYKVVNFEFDVAFAKLVPSPWTEILAAGMMFYDRSKLVVLVRWKIVIIRGPNSTSSAHITLHEERLTQLFLWISSNQTSNRFSAWPAWILGSNRFKVKIEFNNLATYFLHPTLVILFWYFNVPTLMWYVWSASSNTVCLDWTKGGLSTIPISVIPCLVQLDVRTHWSTEPSTLKF